MPDRERLTELLENSFIKSYDDFGMPNINQVADHLLANGVIVPPCKVGDEVYVVSQGSGFNVVWNVHKGKVTDIHFDRYGKCTVRVETARVDIGGYCDISMVFHEEKDAEAALKLLLEKLETDGK